MTEKTLTDRLFDLTAPYDNPYQGSDPRLLFVCSAGLLRSATGANHYASLGFNTRNCGTHQYALIPLSANLIMWADKIIFVNRENYVNAMAQFLNTGYDEDLKQRSLVLDIPDMYGYKHPELIKAFEASINVAELWALRDMHGRTDLKVLKVEIIEDDETEN